MEEYGSYNWNQQGNEPQNNTPMEPKKQPGKRNRNGAKWAKKIGAVALSAVLFGGVAGGVFTGVTYATGATAKAKATQTESDSSQQTTTTKLQTATASKSTVHADRQQQTGNNEDHIADHNIFRQHGKQCFWTESGCFFYRQKCDAVDCCNYQ